ncbi:prolipoprotein diacylglyceryl transferase [bacterium]|nr:prolipoprotein diacylglyceryl transferase [bacterium]
MHPFILELGPFSIKSYGLFIAIGFLAGIRLSSHLLKRDGVSSELVVRVAVWTLLGGLLGARLLYAIVAWEDTLAAPLSVIFSTSGFVFYGGLIGGLATAVYVCRKNRIPYWWLGDAAAPTLALGQAFGRIGCFMFGCCHGRVCDSAWGVAFPEHWRDGRLIGAPAAERFPDPSHPGWSLPVVPTQLWEAGALFILCALLVFLYDRRKFVGQTLLEYLAAYGMVRFTLEFWRGDPRGSFLWFSTSQWIALGMIAFALGMWPLRRGYRNLARPALPDWALLPTSAAKKP